MENWENNRSKNIEVNKSKIIDFVVKRVIGVY